MKAFLRVLWRMIRAYLFYPAMIAIFIWLTLIDAHWIFGLAVIAAILILDPIWRVMAKNGLRMWKNRKNSD